jgi:hypothetical protein
MLLKIYSPLKSQSERGKMKPWFAILLLFGACTSGPQQETSEQKLSTQAKAIEQAVDTMVKEAVADFEVAEIPGDAANQADIATASSRSN